MQECYRSARKCGYPCAVTPLRQTGTTIPACVKAAVLVPCVILCVFSSPPPPPHPPPFSLLFLSRLSLVFSAFFFFFSFLLLLAFRCFPPILCLFLCLISLQAITQQLLVSGAAAAVSHCGHAKEFQPLQSIPTWLVFGFTPRRPLTPSISHPPTVKECEPA